MIILRQTVQNNLTFSPCDLVLVPPPPPKKLDASAAQLKETTMDPAKRAMLRVVLLADDREGTADSVERLMGSKAEARFAFISDKAEFASEDLLGV